MRVVLQKVKSAKVEVKGKLVSTISEGILLLVGIEDEDNREDIEWLCKKIINLRIFEDKSGKMNLSIKKVNAEILAVSQFTLHANIKKGNRPSFNRAAKAEKAEPSFELFRKELKKHLDNEVKTGIFGESMQVSLINDGPLTLIMDSKNKAL